MDNKPPRRSSPAFGKAPPRGLDNSEVEASQEEIAAQLGMSHQAISLSLVRTMKKIRSALVKLEASNDFDHRNPDDAAVFLLALRGAFADRVSGQPVADSPRFCYLVKPLKFEPLKSNV